MKKKILAVLFTALLLSSLLTAAAEGENSGDFGTGYHWEYNEGVLTVSGANQMPDFTAEQPAPWDALKTDITSIVFSGTITSVGNYAFAGTKVTSVTIPEGVLTIGNNAFASCDQLTGVTLPSTLQIIGGSAFTGTGITGVVIPASVTALDATAFPSTLATATVPCGLAASLPAGCTKTLKHTATEIAQEDATLTATGKLKHWKCTSCQTLFSDADCLNITSDANLTIPTIQIGVVLGSSTVYAPGSVTIQMTVNTQSMSAAKSGTITFSNLTTGGLAASCDLAAAGNVLTGTLNLTSSMTAGDYSITNLSYTDNDNKTHNFTYSTLGTSLQSIKLSVKTGNGVATPSTTSTLTLNATSVGYGGVVTGTVVLKDTNGNPLANMPLYLYVNSSKTTTTCTTDANGNATFNYSNSTPGTYTLMVEFAGTDYYYSCRTNTVGVTFTTVPSTGDEYDVMLWVFIGLLAITANGWFVLNKRKAFR